MGPNPHPGHGFLGVQTPLQPLTSRQSDYEDATQGDCLNVSRIGFRRDMSHQKANEYVDTPVRVGCGLAMGEYACPGSSPGAPTM